MTDQEIQDFIDGNEWRFAKTMPQHPHWYVVRDRCTSRETFEKFVIHIREHGYTEYFYSKAFIMFNFGKYKYWTYGSELYLTRIINRTFIDKTYS